MLHVMHGQIQSVGFQEGIHPQSLSTVNLNSFRPSCLDNGRIPESQLPKASQQVAVTNSSLKIATLMHIM